MGLPVEGDGVVREERLHERAVLVPVIEPGLERARAAAGEERGGERRDGHAPGRDYPFTTGSAIPASAFIRPDRKGSRSRTASLNPADFSARGQLVPAREGPVELALPHLEAGRCRRGGARGSRGSPSARIPASARSTCRSRSGVTAVPYGMRDARQAICGLSQVGRP